MSPTTVVVVNDDPQQLHLISALLRRDGLRILPCHGAEEALRVMRDEQEIGAIVTDLHMPGIDGWRFCHLVRSPEYEPFNTTPILVLSATFSGTEAEQLTADLGANAFLSAPFEPSELRAWVRKLLQGRSPRASLRVLLIEGREPRARALRQTFEAHGYAVIVAPTATEGLRLFWQHKPEITLIGSQIPDTAADQLVEELKPPGSATVVISITSARSPERGLRLLKRGVDACVSEPFEPEYLIEVSRQARRQRALIRVEELFFQRTRALRSSEARFRALFEGIPETVFVRAENGTVLHVNDVGARRWGLSAAELVGENLETLLQLPPGVELVWNRPGSAGPPPRAFEATMVSQSGRRMDVDVNERRIDFEGRPAVLSVARDVTAKRELERQRADFLAMLTHDIRNPLSVVLGYTAMLEELGDLREEQREILSRIVTNSQSVLSLVNNYLDLAKIEAGRVSLEKQAIVLNDLLRRVAERYEIEARRKSIDLELDFDDEIPRISGDPLALERVFTNLLHNALKFTPDRGRVRIVSARRDGTVSAVISDTGPGIAPRELATIFEKYRRSASGSPQEGTGLGLFIARALVEAHGGRIAVDTSTDAGSRFEVLLPYL